MTEITDAKKRNKNKNCLTIILICFLIIFVASITAEQVNKIDSIEVVFDATQFLRDNKTISEAELIKLIGKPDSIEEWNYKTSYQVLVNKTPTYPIRQLNYGNYEYLFNNDMLQRINIYEEIPYKNTANILKMFNLKKYANTDIANNNVSYRAKDCGIPDFWVPSMDKDNLNIIKISYGTFWSD